MCDVVIINVQNQISVGMSRTMEICTKALNHLRDAKMPQPLMFFVQNQANESIFIITLIHLFFFDSEKFHLKLVLTYSEEGLVTL